MEPEILMDRAMYLTLTNKSDLLDADYEPSDLVNVTAKHVSGSFQLRKECNEAINKMFAAAADDGCVLYVKSAYRSYQTQRTMYYNRLDKVGRDDGVVAYPGSSDHQTGLGLDILNLEWTKKDGMTTAFGTTKEAQWMAEHCQEYGFVIRYMEDKADVTGIIYEPWHLRYVGLEAAQYIMENHLALEEFHEEASAYIAQFEQENNITLSEFCRLRALPNDLITLETETSDGDQEVSMFYSKEK